MKIIDPETMRKMQAHFEAGTGIRATAREVGLDRKTVAKYYAKRTPTLCSCGKPMTHNGWCSYRVAKSPGRQAMLANLTTLKADTKRTWLAKQNLMGARTRYLELLARLNAAWSRQAVMRENLYLGVDELVVRANKAVQRRCVPQILDDVVQDLLLELLSGNLEAEGLDRSPAVGRIINKNYRLLMPASNVSLNDYYGNGRSTFISNLAADTPLFSDAIVTKY